jgi:hypothetical protein
MLGVIILTLNMLSVIMLPVFMLSTILLSVVTHCVVLKTEIHSECHTIKSIMHSVVMLSREY